MQCSAACPDNSNNTGIKLIAVIMPSLIAIAGIGLTALLAYRYAIKQKRMDIRIGIEKTRYERKLYALENCWKLMTYTSDTENTKTILIWEKSVENAKIYYVNTDNCKEFIKELNQFFYGSGLGIYLTTEIKEKLFEYRSIIYGILLKEKENKEIKIRINNPELAANMIKLHQQMIKFIKEETVYLEKDVNV